MEMLQKKKLKKYDIRDEGFFYGLQQIVMQRKGRWYVKSSHSVTLEKGLLKK